MFLIPPRIWIAYVFDFSYITILLMAKEDHIITL